VSDPLKRAGFRPAPVLRGRSRHGCQCLCRRSRRPRSRPSARHRPCANLKSEHGQVVSTSRGLSCGTIWSSGGPDVGPHADCPPSRIRVSICARRRQGASLRSARMNVSGLRALTAPARRSRSGSYAMAGELCSGNRTHRRNALGEELPEPPALVEARRAQKPDQFLVRCNS
jgi:hypothetical protein